MNRGIPIAIAVYRYCCVFHDSIIKDPRKNGALQKLLIGIIAFNVGVSLSLFLNNPNSFRPYEMCMVREHAFEFNLDDFYVEKNVDGRFELPLSTRSWKILFNCMYPHIFLDGWCWSPTSLTSLLSPSATPRSSSSEGIMSCQDKESIMKSRSRRGERGTMWHMAQICLFGLLKLLHPCW